MSNFEDSMSNLEDLELLRGTAVEKVLDIQRQLASRDRRSPNGGRMTSHEYWSWRQRALTALNAAQSDLRRINRRLAKARADKYATDSMTKLLSLAMVKDALQSLIDAANAVDDVALQADRYRDGLVLICRRIKEATDG